MDQHPKSYRVRYREKVVQIPLDGYETVRMFTEKVRKRFRIPEDIELLNNDAHLDLEDSMIDLGIDPKDHPLQVKIKKPQAQQSCHEHDLQLPPLTPTSPRPHDSHRRSSPEQLPPTPRSADRRQRSVDPTKINDRTLDKTPALNKPSIASTDRVAM